MGRIVVGVDGSESAKAALKWAIEPGEAHRELAGGRRQLEPSDDRRGRADRRTDARHGRAGRRAPRPSATDVAKEIGLADSGIAYTIATPEGRAGEELVDHCRGRRSARRRLARVRAR